MARTPLVVGNWKMELSHKASLEVIRSLKKLLTNVPLSAEVVVCPSHPSLDAVAAALKKSGKGVEVGAQNIHWEERGAWTGQVSVVQIQAFAKWCIVGHSEQRQLGETDELVIQKAQLLLRYGLMPIICIGETASERDSDQTVEKITRQVNSILGGLDRSSLVKTVIAYEPIWAIGTGVTPESDDVAEIILLMRKLITNRYDQDLAERVRILYGGSVKSDNAARYVGGPYADGVLVGGASVHPLQFVDIIKAVQSAWI